jgi:DnaJ-like protein
MPALFFGIVVLVLALWALNGFAKADPKMLAKVLRPAGGIVALAVAAFLFFRGEMQLAVPLGLFGLGLLGWGPFASTGWFRRTQKSAGQASRVRAPFVEMELDHDSGAMRGTVLAGRCQGQSLDAIEVSVLLSLLTEFDADSRALLAAYLDRREPGWREQAQAQGDTAGQGATRRGKMTEEEACQILGVPASASEPEISRAHRGLMKKLHPDQGGSTYLAAQINEAKEVLMRRRK